MQRANPALTLDGQEAPPHRRRLPPIAIVSADKKSEPSVDSLKKEALELATRLKDLFAEHADAIATYMETMHLSSRHGRRYEALKAIVQSIKDNDWETCTQ